MEENDKIYLDNLVFVDPSKDDMDKVFALFRKYVSPNVWTYSVGCDCSNSIVRLYKDLMRHKQSV